MKFQIPRDVLLKALQQLSGVVERRQTLPVLGNILVKANDNDITLAATDLEVELIVKVACQVEEAGEITIPARKWLDICRNLAEDATITVTVSADRATIQAGAARCAIPGSLFRDLPPQKLFILVTIPLGGALTILSIILPSGRYSRQWAIHPV